MHDLYMIEGGLGKNAAFTALTSELVKKSGDKILISAPFHEVFIGNPDVQGTAMVQFAFGGDPRLKNVRNIYGAEPYKSNFLHGEMSLIEGFCHVLDVPYRSDMLPKLYTESASSKAKEFLKSKNIDGPYMLVQFTGGQASANHQIQQQYMSVNPGRNYPHPFARKVVEKIIRSGVTVLDCTLPNEPSYEGAVKCSEHWAVVHELMKGAQGFIGIDSYLNHFSGSAGLQGVVIWGNTSAKQFGYEHNYNLQYHMPYGWESSKFDMEDPRNIMVDPDHVADVYFKKIVIREQKVA